MTDISTLAEADGPPAATSLPAVQGGPPGIPAAGAAPGSEIKDAGVSGTRVRVPLRIHPDTKERVRYWAAKANISVNEYMAEAVEEKIRRENGDYELPTLELLRLNQLIDTVTSLATNVGNLESVTTQGFDSLMGLTRGDNYLLEEDDGELGGIGA